MNNRMKNIMFLAVIIITANIIMDKEKTKTFEITLLLCIFKCVVQDLINLLFEKFSNV